MQAPYQNKTSAELVATCFGFGLNFSQILIMATGGEGEVITFSVGGTEYTAAKSTLRKAPFFARMFDPNLGLEPAYKDSKGNYFIDRSPKPFEVHTLLLTII